MVLTVICIFFILGSCSESSEPLPKVRGKVLVLMYHRIVDGEPANEYERSVSDFEGDLKFIKENNLNILSFNDLQTISKSGRMPLGNSVILTFDDGDQSWYNYVKPLLTEYKMKATFFLWVYMIGQNSFLTWDQVEEMSRYTLAGGEHPFIFGSHSYSHAFLLQRKDGFATIEEYHLFLDYELGQSKAIIEEHVPFKVDAFSFPYGDGAGDPEILAAISSNGYKFARTSRWGNIPTVSSLNFLDIPSLPILDTTTVRLIKYYLEN